MGLLPVEDTLERVLEASLVLPAESTTVDEAVGRVLVEMVVASRTLPPWDNSAMDGYAFASAGLPPSRQLTVVEQIDAGQAPTVTLEAGMCARIMTGAQVPQGADTVVMQERVKVIDDEIVEVLEPPAPGANLRRKGEDVSAGQPLLGEGTLIGLAEAGLLWSQGLTRVNVHRRPRVAIAASGDELCNPWDEPSGRIVDTNSPVIAQAVRRAGGLPTTLGVAPDRLDAVSAHFERGLDHDVLITLAGASVGERDYSKQALESLDVAMDFWRVAMKPGKPFGLGRRNDTLVFALPGNPVSAMVTFELFVRPALRALQGLPPVATTLRATLGSKVSGLAGLRLFVRANTRVEGGQLIATPLPSQSSGSLSSIVGATHLISLAPGTGPLEPGAQIDLIPLSWTT
jgi:molybdopterin molybdotransferase